MKCGESIVHCDICRKGRAKCEILRTNDALMEENADLKQKVESHIRTIDGMRSEMDKMAKEGALVWAERDKIKAELEASKPKEIELAPVDKSVVKAPEVEVIKTF